MYTFDQLKQDVAKEAEALRKHATKEELERLNVSRLDPNHPELCVYGQMTGDCDSERASELIQMCTRVFLMEPGYYGVFHIAPSFTPFRYSPIESYLYMREARNANLISYLKGKTETLEL